MLVPTVTGSATEARRRELGRCVRAYRDLVRPGQVGLPTGDRRRAPGLRREEVAALAGVGVTWYTWLEQGRVAASEQVVDAVGRVLGLDDVGRGHLRALSRPPAIPVSGPEALRPLLASWSSHPAALLDERLDVRATNRVWDDVFGPSTDRALLGMLLDREDDVAELVTAVARRLRMVGNLLGDDARVGQVRAGARAAAPGLAPLWECRAVGAFGRPRVRVDGADREAFLLGEAGSADAAEASVLVLLPADERGPSSP
ncbi:helix-turn-helix domain-containing protein [Actinomycetospora termitidis]|uniref:Helix-turn-helix domain-containing protein n=1 Tax=Actinomycetospora termitidis TaxID=3053470 RepID=A0ABT7MHE1_9PSEU|nr:helix-turn-helix domain-containing protein [Actinomycetospora sp. Odt1-22]MDL5160099.1 helix-turn-helix domain-containing protein [Actinomycetospora sp. Odt1-22]